MRRLVHERISPAHINNLDFLSLLFSMPVLHEDLFNSLAIEKWFETRGFSWQEVEILLDLYDRYTMTPKQRRIRELKEELARLESE